MLARKPIPTVQNTGPYNDALNSEGPIQLNPSLCHMPRVTHAIEGGYVLELSTCVYLQKPYARGAGDS